MPFLKQDPTVPPGQTLTAGFPVLHVGDVPNIDPKRWRLKVSGLVENPFELSWDELVAMPSRTWNGDIHCVTRWSKKDTTWKGVPFAEIVARAKPKASVTHVIQYADNDYTTNLPLSVMLDDDVMVVYEYAGAPIEAVHGGPVRMLVPKKYFWKSAKWLRRLEFLDHDERGFWEVRGYNNDADPWKEERYSDLPSWG
jgi:DMSO/TMAO reductase YedYZ molybdopterin-dependent catalytic subunit